MPQWSWIRFAAIVFSCRVVSRVKSKEIDVSPWYGRSIFFLVVDRFAKPGVTEDKQCGVWENTEEYTGGGAMGMYASQWCGGNIKGIIERLDYIQGMGFDAIWMTPVIQQVSWRDRAMHAPYDGYKAMNWNKIDHHFGTEEDLLQLGHELRSREMLLMMDTVVNHGGETWTLDQLRQFPAPFNDPKGPAFNQLFRNKALQPEFTDYLRGMLSIPLTTEFAKAAPKYGDGLSCHWPGDYFCGWNETIEWSQYSLWSDINQSYGPAGDYLKDWISKFVKKYSLDGLRLDTACEVPRSFLGEWQQAAGVFVLGEVMVPSNLTFYSLYQKPDTLTGATNMPVVYQWARMYDSRGFFDRHRIADDFENDVWDVWQPKETTFAKMQVILEEQARVMRDTHLLGNFVDSHDTNRFLWKHYQDVHMLMNALVWVFFWQGLPIFYQGTMDGQVGGLSSERASMWYQGQLQKPYNTGAGYQFVKRVNKLRQHLGFGHSGQHVRSMGKIHHADQKVLVFSRGDVLIGISNGKNASSPYVCLNASEMPWPIQKACGEIGLGLKIYLRMGGAHADCNADEGFPQICMHMIGTTDYPASHLIVGAKLPPKSSDAAQDALVSLAIGAAIFISVPAYFYRRHVQGHKVDLCEDTESASESE